MSCNDCGKYLAHEERTLYMVGGLEYYKCPKCYDADPILRNFQPTEVYSRVVGYIRPVKQWNKGKSEEFGDRREYKPL